MSGFVPGETPEGWYADLQAGPTAPPGAERWWNGVQWTAHTRVPEAAPPVAPPEPQPAAGPAPAAPAPAAPAPAAPVAPPAGTSGAELFLYRTNPDGTTSLGLPAGVEVRTPYGAVVAAPGPRIIAFLVDTLVAWLLTAALALPLSLVGAVLRSLADLPVRVPVQLSLFWLLGIAVCWTYHAIGLSRWGASFGQRRMRIGVRPWQANARLSRRQVVLRSLLATVTFAGALLASPVLGMLAFGVLAAPVVTGTTRRGLHEVWTDTCTIQTGAQPAGPRTR